MKQIIIYTKLLVCMLACCPAFSQTTALPKQWDYRFGASDEDQLTAMKQTADGGYILGGWSFSGKGGDKSETSRSTGYSDYWIVKIDSTGTKQWDKTFGGNNIDELYTIIQTTDGGYIFGGKSKSDKSGDKTANSRGFADFWVVKTDANGIKQWDSTYGGNDDDILVKINSTADGGYILGGYSLSDSSGDKTSPSEGKEDYWIVKINANGTKQWDKTIGGSDADILKGIQQTTDGGYILGGYSSSNKNGDKSKISRGYHDYWVVKTDINGLKVWDNTYGANAEDLLYDLQQTAEGGYILGGYSNSDINYEKTQANIGYGDYWLVKIGSTGLKQWDKVFGTFAWDYFTSLKQTSDGGYLLAGYTLGDKTGDKSYAGWGSNDFWIIKTDINGIKKWDTDFGGTDDDYPASLVYTSDSSIAVGGYSYSLAGGDKTQGTRGRSDYWVIKLGCPPYASIKPLGSLDICLTDSVKLQAGNGYGLKYQWVKDNIKITGATKRIYTAKTTGTYKVAVYTNAQCLKISTGVNVTNSCGTPSFAINEIQKINTLNIFPNPSTGSIAVTYTSNIKGNVQLSVYDKMGRLMFSKKEEATYGRNMYRLNLSNRIDGTYTLKITMGDITSQAKFIIAK